MAHENLKSLVKFGVIIGGAVVSAVVYDRWSHPKNHPAESRPEIQQNTRERVTSATLPRPDLLFGSDDFVAPISLLTKLKLARSPLEQYLRTRFDRSTNQLIDDYSPPAYPEPSLLRALTFEFNRLVSADQPLYQSARFADVKLLKDTLAALESHSSDYFVVNRMLLEDTYPYEIRSRQREIERTEEVGTVTVEDLLNDFKNSKGGKYLGKRYFIRGTIGEVVGDQDGAGRYSLLRRPLRLSVMLVSRDNLPYPEMQLPFDRETYFPLVGANRPSVRSRQSSVQFEGVYCLFLHEFSPRVSENLIPREKTELMVSCEIGAFEKGMTTVTTEYEGSHAKDRIIAVNCEEKRYVLEKSS